MKKLKSLCAIVGVSTILCSGAAFAAEQKFDIPKYSTKDIPKETVEEILKSGGKISTEFYLIDRNKDGETDLIECQEYEFKDGKQLKHEKWLIVDDDYDGYVDRMLGDFLKADGTEGVDGIYDEESKDKLNMKLVIRYLRHTSDELLLNK